MLLLALTLLSLHTASATVTRTATSPAQPTAHVQAQEIQAGTYDLAILTGGGQIDATMEISYVRDSMKVVLKVGDHESPVKPGERRGNKLTLVPTSSALDVKYDLEFKGNDVTGTFIYQGQPGNVSGKRRTGR